MKMFNRLLGLVMLASFAFGVSVPVFAANPQNWYKKINQSRPRRAGLKQTSVAAVRGVDEPSQVDPEARNYEAVDKMENRNIPQEKVNQFIKDGKLGEPAQKEAEPAKPATEPEKNAVETEKKAVEPETKPAEPAQKAPETVPAKGEQQ